MIQATAPPNQMRVHLIALAAAFSATTMAAPSTDRLHSAGCVSAMSALRDVGVAMAGSTESSKGVSAADSRALAKLAELKRVAARTCLGGDGTAPPVPQQIGQKPISVAPVSPVAVTPNPSGLGLPEHTSPRPTTASVAPLTSITSCDPVGCWASDGTRLQKVGPNLLGPKGFCTVQGYALNCP